MITNGVKCTFFFRFEFHAVPCLVSSHPADPDVIGLEHRFEREAQALAALNHPHIVTIFSVEEADDLRFLTMELVEGKTLADAIPRAGLSLSLRQ